MEALKKQIALKDKKNQSVLKPSIFEKNKNIKQMNTHSSNNTKSGINVNFMNDISRKSTTEKIKKEKITLLESLSSKKDEPTEPNINAIFKLSKIMERRCLSLKYIQIILSYFIPFFEFLYIKKKNQYNEIKKIKEKDGITYYYINNINLDDVYAFVNSFYQKYKETTRNYILSKMKKYSNLINENIKDNYKKKLYFKKNINSAGLINSECIKNIIDNFKNKDDIENLIIFYFLYFSGLTFSDIARILFNHFKMNFSLLIIKHGRTKKINIPKVIQELLITSNEKRKNLSQFFFYEGYKDNKTLRRTEFIKHNFSQAMISKNINYNIRLNLIREFSKTRNHKILSQKNYYLFSITPKDRENEKSESFYCLSLEEENNDKYGSISDKSFFDENENSLHKKIIKFDNFEISSFDEEINDISKIEKSLKNQKRFEYLLENDINSNYGKENKNSFFRKRISCNLQKYFKNK